jgi:hypothetical protein
MPNPKLEPKTAREQFYYETRHYWEGIRSAFGISILIFASLAVISQEVAIVLVVGTVCLGALLFAVLTLISYFKTGYYKDKHAPRS